MYDASGEDRIDALREKAFETDGEGRVALLREAVRLADLSNDLRRGMELRDDLLHAASDAGFFEDELLAFNWMLAQMDRDRATWGGVEDHLLWCYKWILEHLPEFPQVSNDQLAKTFQDMERRFRRAGHGLKSVHKLRAWAAVRMGDLAEAARFEGLWQSTQRDRLADCAACEVGTHVEYLVFAGRDEDAVAAAAPLFGGRMKCKEVPNTAFSRLLVPLLRSGRQQQAAACQQQSFAQMRDSRKFISYIADHLSFFALAGEETKAVKLLEARLPWAEQTRNGFSRFRFDLAARLLLARLHASGRQTLRLRLPSSHPAYRPDDQYATGDLAGLFLGAAREVASEFDRRNGNDHFTARLIPQNEQLIALPTVPLPEKFRSGLEAA